MKFDLKYNLNTIREMNVQTLDYLYRSRKTILSILSSRKYNTKPYEKFGYEEIEAMASGASGGARALRMDLERPAESTDTPITKCRVEYCIGKMKQKVDKFISEMLPEDDLGTEESKMESKQAELDDNKINPKTTEVIVILIDDTHPMADIFHSRALEQWNKRQFRISFFLIDNLVNNPAEHVLVPKHERVPSKDHKDILKKYYTDRKAQLPWIVFHVDIQARILGLVPGDIVKITRGSPSAGYYTEYRVCAP